LPGLQLSRLRAQIAALAPPVPHGVLPLDGGAVDAALGGGLALGALHAVEGAGIEAETCAVPAAFLARLVAALPSPLPIFWIAQNTDLYAPGLIGHGFDPSRLIQLRCVSDDETLGAMETLLRSKAVACVIAETARVSPLAGRRLQMACLGSGTTGFVLRRFLYGRRATEPIQAAVTRWRLGPSPSLKIGRLPGRPRWRAELLHTRSGPATEWILEQEDREDATHPFRVATGLAHPQIAARRLAG
jgi:protein ImuA